MIRMTPQARRVLDYLKEKRSGITVAECNKNLKTTELRKIISTLKQKGFSICDRWEWSENSFGEKVRYKRYFLMTKGVKKQ